MRQCDIVTVAVVLVHYVVPELLLGSEHGAGCGPSLPVPKRRGSGSESPDERNHGRGAPKISWQHQQHSH